jgi:hypothetical protein
MIPMTAMLLAPLVAAQSGGDLRLARGQEMTYRGTYSETAAHGGTEYRRTFDLEIRVFVLDVGPAGANLAVCTALRAPTAGGPPAVRFELARVDARGRVSLASGEPPPLTPDGPPALECAGFVERPPDDAGEWSATGVHPPLRWRAAGTEIVHGVRCVQLAGEQQSPDWNRLSADQPAWRRTETVWLSADNGIVERLERDMEWRKLGERDSIIRSKTVYDLHGGVSSYPDPLGQDRRSEIRHAARFQNEYRRLLAGRASPAAFDALIGRIDAVLAETPATPFRSAIVATRQAATAAKRGDAPP